LSRRHTQAHAAMLGEGAGPEPRVGAVVCSLRWLTAIGRRSEESE